jgi:hypothetical protein
MADFSKSGCCDCGSNKSCPDAFADFAAELCSPSPSKKDKSKAK